MNEDERKKLANKGWLMGSAYEFVQPDASAQLNNAIEEALAPYHAQYVNHDVFSDAKDAAQQVEARMRSGAFGGFFVDHDLKIGYDVFGALTWRITGKF